MTIRLRADLEKDVRRLARERGGDVEAVVAEAVRQYIEAAAITDVSPEDMGRTQEALSGELQLEEWGEEGKKPSAPR